MLNRRDFLQTLSVAGTTLVLGLPARADDTAPVAATAITQVFGDGIRLTHVAVEYPVEVAGPLAPGDFTVTGRTITAITPATAADPVATAASGRFVLIALSPDDPSALLEIKAPQPAEPAPADGTAPAGPPAAMPERHFAPAAAEVAQTASLTTASGASLPLGPVLKTSAVHNLIVDDFKPLSFTDPQTGETLAYNLFTPKLYDPAIRYPLVVFMHDASATSANPQTTLMQGLGAVIWASPEDQAARPAFVLAPQYAKEIANDLSQTTTMMPTTFHLIESLLGQYSIDPSRLYATGQSGGCMQAIAMNIDRPGFFAGSFLVAGQWDAKTVAPLARTNLWIVVSQDDAKAFPGQNAITEAIEAQGTPVARAVWDATWGADQVRFAADALLAQRAAVNYVSFAKGTVFPLGSTDTSPGSGHTNTWRVAYTLEPIRDWLFRQTAPAAAPAKPAAKQAPALHVQRPKRRAFRLN